MGVEERNGSRNALYLVAAAAALVSVAGGLFDIAVGSVLGGLAGIPEDAVGRFAQFARNPWLGLYYLDALNCVTTLLLLPATLAVCMLHRKTLPALAACTLVCAVVGTTLFIGGNSALTMLSLSRAYEAAGEARKVLIAAAGEAMIARGEHGGPAVFPAFMLCSFASFLSSLTQFRGKIFSRACAVFGLAGNALLMVYLVLVTFVPGLKTAAVALAAPGGIMALVWTVMTAITLIRASKKQGGLE